MNGDDRLYRFHQHPGYEEPVLVVYLDGWIDAGLGATAAMASLVSTVPTDVVATFDTEILLDYRARRPTLRIVDGVNTGLAWPEIQVRGGQDRAGHGLFLLVGPEPDHRWHGFVDAVVGLAGELDVRLAVGLGAFPAPVPHTRPAQLVATASSPELAQQIGFVGGSIEVPAGIQSALEQAFTAAGIPAVTLWARVPHYVATMSYPAASAELLDGLGRVAGLEVYTGELRKAADETRARLDGLVAGNDEHVALVRQLEAQADAAESASAFGTDLPSGDELAAEIQRFLHDEGRG
jgi:hypothetical protein